MKPTLKAFTTIVFTVGEVLKLGIVWRFMFHEITSRRKMTVTYSVCKRTAQNVLDFFRIDGDCEKQNAVYTGSYGDGVWMRHMWQNIEPQTQHDDSY